MLPGLNRTMRIPIVASCVLTAGVPGVGSMALTRKEICLHEGQASDMARVAESPSSQCPQVPRAGVSFTSFHSHSLSSCKFSHFFFLSGPFLQLNLYSPLASHPSPFSSSLPTLKCNSTADFREVSHGSGWC